MCQNYRDKNLQGWSFKDKDLTGADFSGSDIRGANFTNANLTNASFIGAKAGVQKHWVIGLLIVASLLSGISGVAAVSNAYNTVRFIIPNVTKPIPIIAALTFCFLSLVLNGVLWRIILRQGIQKTLGIIAATVGIAVPIIGILAAFGTKARPWFIGFRVSNISQAAASLGTNSEPAQIIVLGALIIAATIAIVVSLTFAVVLAVIAVADWLRYLVVAEAMAIATIATGIVTRNSARYFSLTIPKEALAAQSLVIAIAVILAGAFIFLSDRVANRTLAEDEKYNVLLKIAIAIATIGGTSFRKSDLTNANFSHATLKNTDLRKANVKRSFWYKSIKLNWANVEGTILEASKVRDLLVTGDGCKKSYAGANLRGANLDSANLADANFKTADLTEATLRYACLDWANLSQTQAVGADFTKASMTGVCLEAWNIDSTTLLDEVESKFYYLRENPKSGTDDRERRPHDGEFAPGEFTKLLQEISNTVDLILHSPIDWKALFISLQQLQVKNEETELYIQGIENKGDGVFVVKVNVPSDVKKSEVYGELTQLYKVLKGKEKQILLMQEQTEYRNRIMNFIVTRGVLSSHNKILPDNLVVINFENGNFEQGFRAIAAHIWSDEHPLPTKFTAKLLPNLEIAKLYQQFHLKYENLRLCYESQGWIPRIKKLPSQVSQVSLRDIPELKKELQDLANQLKIQINLWLNSKEFSLIQQQLRSKLDCSHRIRVIIQAEDIQMRRIPWHLWDFFQDYPHAEVALCAAIGDRVKKSVPPRTQIRILAILGDSKGINVNADRKALEDLSDAETVFLVKPTFQEVEAAFLDEKGWDIFCFSGHSSSDWNGNKGWIQINENERLTIQDLEEVLKVAIERGLQLAIFNSCDGLGLARKLANLQIPQMIVMREAVPDLAAQDFLKNFLKLFADGNSLYVAVRKAREMLQREEIENRFPCVSWLPTICQNQAEVPQTWQELHSRIQPKFENLLAQLKAAIKNEIYLTSENKIKAIGQINILAATGQNPEKEEKQKQIKSAFNILMQISNEEPAATQMAEALNKLLIPYIISGGNYV